MNVFNKLDVIFMNNSFQIIRYIFTCFVNIIINNDQISIIFTLMHSRFNDIVTVKTIFRLFNFCYESVNYFIFVEFVWFDIFHTMIVSVFLSTFELFQSLLNSNCHILIDLFSSIQIRIHRYSGFYSAVFRVLFCCILKSILLHSGFYSAAFCLAFLYS